MIYFSSAFVMK